MRRTNSLRRILFILSACLVFTGLGKAYSWAFTHSLVRQARAEGVYPTAVEAMEAFIEENYTGITSIISKNRGKRRKKLGDSQNAND